MIKDVKCQVIDPETWQADKEVGICRNVMFILKEAPVGDNFDLQKHLLKGGRGYTYSNVALWLFLLRHFGRDEVNVSFSEATKKKNPTTRAKLFRHVAVVNINDKWKKSKGKSSDDAKLLRDYSKERHSDIEAVITECDPEIVVTCGRVVLNCLRKFNANIKKITKVGTIPAKAYAYEINGTVRLLIAMPHPNAHIRQALMYKELSDLLVSIRLK